jgi:hypothetical protein
MKELCKNSPGSKPVFKNVYSSKTQHLNHNLAVITNGLYNELHQLAQKLPHAKTLILGVLPNCCSTVLFTD